MHSGFSVPAFGALPMNIKAHFPKYKVWSRAQGDIARDRRNLERLPVGTYGGPYLFGAQPCMADAMYAPVVTRFLTYDVALDPDCAAAYCKTHHGTCPPCKEWVEAARRNSSPTRSTNSKPSFETFGDRPRPRVRCP